tara:strand:+ start:112785 stop:112925 length:141 start_codon:yes stop_codon:yes gene_type:complete
MLALKHKETKNENKLNHILKKGRLQIKKNPFATPKHNKGKTQTQDF